MRTAIVVARVDQRRVADFDRRVIVEGLARDCRAVRADGHYWQQNYIAKVIEACKVGIRDPAVAMVRVGAARMSLMGQSGLRSCREATGGSGSTGADRIRRGSAIKRRLPLPATGRSGDRFAWTADLCMRMPGILEPDGESRGDWKDRIDETAGIVIPRGRGRPTVPTNIDRLFRCTDCAIIRMTIAGLPRACGTSAVVNR